MTRFQVEAIQSCPDRHLLSYQLEISASVRDSSGESPERHSGLSLFDRSTAIGVVYGQDPPFFHWIRIQVPDLQVVLVATEFIPPLPCCMASNLDPQAFATDALSLDWILREDIYLFSQVNCLLKVLHNRGPSGLWWLWWPPKGRRATGTLFSWIPDFALFQSRLLSSLSYFN